MSVSEMDDKPFRAAPVRTRLAAGILDFFLVLAAALILLPPKYGYFPILFVLYHSFFLWLLGKTPAKALLGLEVKRLGRSPGPLWALARSSIGLFLVNGFGLGFLAALGDSAHRALHDRAFGSVVVLDEAVLSVHWSRRLRRWAESKKALQKKKTETVVLLAGVWTLLEWAAAKIERAAQVFEGAIEWLRSSSEATTLNTLPSASTPAQSAVLAVACSGVTTAVLLTVPGATEVAGAVSSPVAAIAAARDEGALRLVRGPAGGTTQLAIGGQPAEIRAGLETLRYKVDFGDGTAPASGAVGGDPFLSFRHEYADSSPGTRYDVVLTVADDAGRIVGTADYRVEFVDPDDEDDRTLKAIGDALWWLHREQAREDHPTFGQLGHWQTRWEVGETALATLAFEVNGFQGGSGEGAYSNTVNRALAFLLSRCKTVPIEPQPAGNPDSNANGFGIIVQSESEPRPLYEVPLVVMALVASRRPGEVAATGPPGIRGRRYDEIVVDMLDFIAFAQDDSEEKARGGWRYNVNEGADMSVTQWPAMAMAGAEEVWGIPVPEWVKRELRDNFLRSAQDESSGGFGYLGPTDATLARTAAGLIALSFAGVPEDDARVTKAVDYIEENWESAPDRSNYYTMYTVMKAAKLRSAPLQRFGEHDWQSEYRKRLLQTQDEEGSWPSDGANYNAGVLATAWPVLLLSEEVFAESRATALLRWIRDAF